MSCLPKIKNKVDVILNEAKSYLTSNVTFRYHDPRGAFCLVLYLIYLRKQHKAKKECEDYYGKLRSLSLYLRNHKYETFETEIKDFAKAQDTGHKIPESWIWETVFYREQFVTNIRRVEDKFWCGDPSSTALIAVARVVEPPEF